MARQTTKATEKAEQVVDQVTAKVEQVASDVAEKAEQVQAEAIVAKKDFAQSVQDQIVELKTEFLKRVETLKAQFPVSQTELVELKETLKVELTALLEDFNKVSKDIKEGKISPSYRNSP